MAKSDQEILPSRLATSSRIYAYSIDDEAHKGLLKVGQTTRDVKQRVAEQLGPAIIKNYKILLDEPAERNDGTLITDRAVRAALVKKKFENTEREWMRCTAEDVKAVLTELRASQQSTGTRHETFVDALPKLKTTISPADLPDTLVSQGRYCATTAELSELTGPSEAVLRTELARPVSMTRPLTSIAKLISVLRFQGRNDIDLTVDRKMLERISQNPRWLLSDMHKRGLAHPVQRGRYLVNLDGIPSKLANFYALEPLVELLLRRLAQPYYLSWHSALWHHGLLDQQSNRLQVAVTFRKRPARFETFEINFVTVRPRKFFDWIEVEPAQPPAFLKDIGIGGAKVAVATLEKALIDAFDRPELTAPMAIVAYALRRAWRSKLLDPERLVADAVRFGSPFLNRRLGFFMQEWEIPGCEKLRIHLGRSSAIALAPGGATSAEVDKHWLVYRDPYIVETARNPK